MIYDITCENWIPVLMKNGSKKKLNLIDIFIQSPHIKGFDGLNPMEEFSLHRFLVLFLMDVYRPEDIDDIIELLASQQFDKEVIQDYINSCRQEGVTFDLFDTNHPFMQSSYDTSYDDQSHLKPVAVLDYTLPSGNNPVHFIHQFEKDSIMFPDKAFITLLSNYIFCTSGTQGPSGVYGAPPVFFVPQGNNLFETLILSMIPLDESDVGKVQEKTMWRNNTPVIPKKIIAKTSFWYGMFFPSRRILLTEESGNVGKVYYQAGMDYQGYDSWTDPYVLYQYNTKGVRTSLKPSLDKEYWRNIGTLMTNFSSAPVVLQQLEEILEDFQKSVIPIMIFGAVTENASYESLQKGFLQLDIRITRDSYKRQLICKAAEQAEQDALALRKSLQTMMGNNKTLAHEIMQYLHQFYIACEPCFYQLIERISLAKENKEYREALNMWSQILQCLAEQQYDHFGAIFCRTAEDFLGQELGKRELYRQLKKAKKWSEMK